MAHGLRGEPQGFLELGLELLLLFLDVLGELAPLGTDGLEVVPNLLIGMKPTDVLGRDAVGLEVLVHVPGEYLAVLTFAEDAFVFALPLHGLAECGNDLGVGDRLLVLDP